MLRPKLPLTNGQWPRVSLADTSVQESLAEMLNEHATQLDAIGAIRVAVFDVTVYGAIGDGVTDDSVAVRSAVAAAQTHGGGIVYFPNGTYLLSENGTSFKCLAPPSGVSLRGESRYGAVLKLAPNQRAGVRMVWTASGATDITVSDLSFDGNKAGQVGSDAHGDAILTDNASRVIVERLNIYNCRGSGVSVWQNSTDVTIEHCYIHNCDWNGIVLGDAGGQHRITVRKCLVTGNVGGLHIEVSAANSDIMFDQCYTDASVGSYALEIAGTPDATKYTNQVVVRGCKVMGGTIVTNANGVSLENCYLYSADNAGTPAVPLKISNGVIDCAVSRCVVVLDTGGTASQAVMLAVTQMGLPTDRISVTDCDIYVNTTAADGIMMQTSGIGRIERCYVIGNSGVTAGHYGINVNLSQARSMDAAIVRGNYVTDFPVGIATQAVSTSQKLGDADISDNLFEVTTVGLLTACVNFEADSRSSVLQARAVGNRCIADAAAMFGSLPHTSGVAVLVGGNRGSASDWVGNGTPAFSAAKGSTYRRLDGAAGTCFYVNESGSTTWTGK